MAGEKGNQLTSHTVSSQFIKLSHKQSHDYQTGLILILQDTYSNIQFCRTHTVTFNFAGHIQ